MRVITTTFIKWLAARPGAACKALPAFAAGQSVLGPVTVRGGQRDWLAQIALR